MDQERLIEKMSPRLRSNPTAEDRTGRMVE